MGLLTPRKEESGDESLGTQMILFNYDRTLMLVILMLMGFGIVMVYSASIISAEVRTGDMAFYLKRQLLYVAISLVMLVTFTNVHHDLLRRLSRPLLALGIVLLAVALVPGVSASAKGAARWIQLGHFRLQPGEAVKIAWIVFLAAFLSERQADLDRWRTAWGVPMLLLAVMGALLMKQPDFGSTLICSGLMVLIIWAAGGRWLHVGLLGGLGAVLVPLAIIVEPYRIKRLLAFLSPEADPQGVSYHINQALISFGSGEWTGLGLGGSKQKLLYLPEAHTDFIFSIVGEELGWVGVASVVVLFAVFVWRGFSVARNASSAFGALLAFGITGLVGFQAATNMAVATALMPTKGLTLPFVSYGGSSIITLGAAIGILLNVSRRQPPPAWHQRLFSAPAPGADPAPEGVA